MSDDTKLDQEQSVKSADEKQLESRRRFAKSGLAGSAIIMSLLSRPASATYGGTNDPKCTGSILASIDAGSSLHGFNPDDCRFGCTPGFWSDSQQGSTPPSGLAWDKIYSITGGQITKNTFFDDVFDCGLTDSGGNKIYTPGFGGQNVRLIDILSPSNFNGVPGNLKNSARHAAAAFLNATIMGVYYSPFSPQQIVTDYCTAFEAWIDSGKTNTNALGVVKSTYEPLNQRGCPLNADPGNKFYQ